MPIRVFPPHYQLVYINFDISSFSLISYNPKAAVLHGKSVGFASQNSRFRNVKAQLSLFNGIIFTKSKKFSTIVLGKKKETNSFNKYRQPYFLSSSKT